MQIPSHLLHVSRNCQLFEISMKILQTSCVAIFHLVEFESGGGNWYNPFYGCYWLVHNWHPLHWMVLLSDRFIGCKLSQDQSHSNNQYIEECSCGCYVKKLYSITLLPGATTFSELLQACSNLQFQYIFHGVPELSYHPNFGSLMQDFQLARWGLISSLLSGKLAQVMAWKLLQNLALHSPMLVHSSHMNITYMYLDVTDFKTQPWLLVGRHWWNVFFFSFFVFLESKFDCCCAAPALWGLHRLWAGGQP